MNFGISLKLILIYLSLHFNILSQNNDIDLLKQINGSYTPQGGKILTGLTNSVNLVGFGLPLGLFIAGKVSKNKEITLNSYELFSSLALNAVITTSVKLAVSRPRPFVTYPNEIEKHAKAGSYSFPSGHTSMAFNSATSISLLYPKWYVIAPAYIWACGIGYSRKYLGVHYPSDVLCGALFGSASAIGNHYLFKYFKRRNAKNQNSAPKI